MTADGGFASKDTLAFAKENGIKRAVFGKKRGLSLPAMVKKGLGLYKAQELPGRHRIKYFRPPTGPGP